MKILRYIFTAGVLMSALCAGFVACNDEPDGLESGLGEEIPGLDVKQATGTVVGKYSDTGYGSWLVQVDEEFQIGETFEFYDNRWIPATMMEGYGTYGNIIQIQHKLPIKMGNRISFSIREFQKEIDHDLFIIGHGVSKADHVSPQVPEYIVTEYKIINN